MALQARHARSSPGERLLHAHREVRAAVGAGAGVRPASSIVDATQEAVIFAGTDGRIQLWNGGAERIFGWSAGEAIGQSLDLIIPEKLRGRHWDGWKQVMKTGITRYASDLLAVPAVRKDGARISLEFTVALVRDGAGEIAGVAAVLRDVTERWQRDRELRARLAELEARSQPH